MRWPKVAKGYILKRNVWAALSGFLDVRASSLSLNNGTFWSSNLGRVRNKPFIKGVDFNTHNSCKALIHKRFSVAPPSEDIFRGCIIVLSPANVEVGKETYSFFNTLSKQLGSEMALPFILGIA